MRIAWSDCAWFSMIAASRADTVVRRSACSAPIAYQSIVANSAATQTTNRPAMTRVRRKVEVRNCLPRCANCIAGTTHGMDQFSHKTFVNLAAQAAQMAFDDVRAWIEVQVPNPFQQHR